MSKIFQKNDKYQVIKVDGGKDKRGKNYVSKINEGSMTAKELSTQTAQTSIGTWAVVMAESCQGKIHFHKKYFYFGSR